MLHVWGRGEVYTRFWWRNLMERDYLEDPGVKWQDNIKMDLQKVGCGVWTRSSWFRIKIGGGTLCMR
jgi:hypothetical protein